VLIGQFPYREYTWATPKIESTAPSFDRFLLGVGTAEAITACKAHSTKAEQIAFKNAVRRAAQGSTRRKLESKCVCRSVEDPHLPGNAFFDCD
jgi:hypothetical protein